MSILIIFGGESNSGGYVDNAQCTTADFQPKSQVQILNNNSLVFENLQIGVNNLIGHTGLNANTSHGWELGLADNANILSPPIYLCKTGQGSSKISDWNSGGTYYNTFLSRINKVKELGVASNLTYRPILWYTQGINDAISGNNAADWKAATIAHFQKIRVEFPDIPILFSDVTPQYPTYSAAIVAVTNEVSNCHFIPTSNATLRDSNHWDYTGMKIIAGRMIRKTLLIYPTIGGLYKSELLPVIKPNLFSFSRQNKTSKAKTLNLILDGNSLTAFDIYPPMLPSRIKSGYAMVLQNYAVSGQTTAQMIVDATTQIDIPTNKNEGYNIVFCWEGINDLYHRATAQQCFDNIKNYCLARKAYGFKVIVGTLTPRTNSGTPLDYESKRLIVNDLLRANYNVFADRLVDIGGDPIMGATGASKNATYYVDLVHFTTAGYQIMANLLATAVNNLLIP